VRDYYWLYYLAMLFAAVAKQNPYIAFGFLFLLAVRPWLPDPVVIWRNLGRIGSLKRQIELNPANITARRDLAQAYLDLRWHKSALHYLDEARERSPRDQELAYMRGLALLGARKYDAALRAFAEAVGVDPDRGEPFSSASANTNERTFRRYGEAYLGAARALTALERWQQAEDALDMCLPYNSSTLEPLLLLARVRAARGNEKGASEARKLARKTWSELPGFMRRRQFSLWLRSFF
jgi:tetratricopeptide (TPR) repeat protein